MLPRSNLGPSPVLLALTGLVDSPSVLVALALAPLAPVVLVGAAVVGSLVGVRLVALVVSLPPPLPPPESPQARGARQRRASSERIVGWYARRGADRNSRDDRPRVLAGPVVLVRGGRCCARRIHGERPPIELVSLCLAFVERQGA